MADFSAVLRKAIEALKDNTPEAREKIYGKARATIEAKLAAASPPLSPEIAIRQKGLLDDAISNIEAEYAPPPEAAPDQDDDLDSLFSELDASAENRAPADMAVHADAAEPDDQAGPEPFFTADVNAPAAWNDVPQSDWNEPDEPWDGTGMAGEPDDLHPARDGDAPEWVGAGAIETPEAPPEEMFPLTRDEPRRARRGLALFLPLLIVLVLLGALVGGWFYRGGLAQVAGFDNFSNAVAFLGGGEGEASGGGDEAAQASAPESEAPAAAATASQPAETQQQKFTQRLLPDGSEVDEGPAGGQRVLGEGTSVAAATQSGAAAQEAGREQAGGEGSEEGVPVGQRAIFYEERTSAAAGSANSGSVVWSVTQESPGDNLPPEPTIRAEAAVPEKGLQLKITIRRNVDQSLPASHIVELIFLTPGDFPGGGINNVLRIAMKRNEQDTGNPLLGVPAKIADGFFLVALSDRQADIQTNSTLMQRENWIDIPIVYTSGRRALITLEKGAVGERIFQEALEAWRTASSEASTE